MSREVILASHGGLADGMADTLTMILGTPPYPTRTYCLQPGESAEAFAEEIRNRALTHPETHFIVLVDLLGASVFTALCGLSVLGNVSIVAGMNVALALAALTERDETEEALAQWGREGVKGCQETLLNESDDKNEF